MIEEILKFMKHDFFNGEPVDGRPSALLRVDTILLLRESKLALDSWQRKGYTILKQRWDAYSGTTEEHLACSLLLRKPEFEVKVLWQAVEADIRKRYSDYTGEKYEYA